MKLHPATSANELIESTFVDYENLKLAFTDSTYWNQLKYTYVRTLDDILKLRKTHFKHDNTNSSGLSLLEIGAFSGILSTAFARTGFEVTAQDIQLFMKDPVLLEHYSKEGIATVASNLADIPVPLPDAKFDIIICCEVLEHLNFNVLPVLRDFARMLKPGGIVYIATPNQANIVKRLSAIRGRSVHDAVERFEWQLVPDSTFSIGLHWREYTADELRQLLHMSGFAELSHSYCHYNTRSNSAPWRRSVVSAMYSMFPSFLPGQIIVGKKL